MAKMTLTQAQINDGIENVIRSAVSRHGWSNHPLADDIQQEAVCRALSLVAQKNLSSPLAYIREASKNILITVARDIGTALGKESELTDEVIESASTVDRRHEAKDELQIQMDRLQAHIEEGRAMYRQLKKIRDAI